MSLLGIDIGTSSICGVVYTPSSDRIVSVTKANEAGMSSPHTWEKTQDVRVIAGIVHALIRELRQTCPDIEGIGLTGQMHGILYVDTDGNPVSPLYTWQDDRGSRPYRDGLSYAAYLSSRTGLSLSAGFGLVTHFYNQENGLVPPKAAKLCTIMDYIAMILIGDTAPVIDSSNASGLGFFNKRRLTFDRPALYQAGINPSILPEVKDFALPIGYYSGIPVYPAIGDNQASFLGSVRHPENSVHITVGTSCQVSVYTDTYIEIPSLDTRPLPGGGYILVGAALCGGYSFALLKNFFAATIRLGTGKEISDTHLYDLMTSVPYKEDAEEDLQVETLFNGTRRQPEKRATISHISLSNLTPEHMILGFLKGMVREMYDFYQLVPASIRKDKTLLVGSGNGLRLNPLLRQILEKRFHRRLYLSPYPEEAALGACICRL